MANFKWQNKKGNDWEQLEFSLENDKEYLSKWQGMVANTFHLSTQEAKSERLHLMRSQPRLYNETLSQINQNIKTKDNNILGREFQYWLISQIITIPEN